VRRALTLVEIRGGAGRATVGSETVVVEPSGPGWRVGADGPVVAPISFAQRSTLLREADLAGDTAAELARGVARAAGADQGASGDPVVQSIALHLAGAGRGDLGFGEVWVAVVAHLGGDAAVVAAMAAADADALAETVVEQAAPEADASWTTLLLAGDDAAEHEPAGETVAADAVAVALAADLIDRARARPIRIHPRHLAADGAHPDVAAVSGPWAADAPGPIVAPATAPGIGAAALAPLDRWHDAAARAVPPTAAAPAIGHVTATATSAPLPASAPAAAALPPVVVPNPPSVSAWPSSTSSPERDDPWGPRQLWRRGGEPWAAAPVATDDAPDLDRLDGTAPPPAAVWGAPGRGRVAADRWRHDPGAAVVDRAATALGSGGPGTGGALAELAARLHHVADARGVAR
jgi:hypothetical protein